MQDSIWKKEEARPLSDIIDNILKEDPDRLYLVRDFLPGFSFQEKAQPFFEEIKNRNLEKAWQVYTEIIFSDLAIRWCKKHNVKYTQPRRYLLWRGAKIYYLEEDVLRSISLPVLLPMGSLLEEEDRFLLELTLVGFRPAPRKLTSFLDPLVGHTWEEVMEAAKSRGEENVKKNLAARRGREESRQKWEDLRSQFGGLILGIDKKFFRSFPSGFAVRVMLKAATPVNVQRSFVEKNREDILLWIMEEIRKTPALMRKIGDLDFFTPTEVILLQNNEMEILFEGKNYVSGESS